MVNTAFVFPLYYILYVIVDDFARQSDVFWHTYGKNSISPDKLPVARFINAAIFEDQVSIMWNRYKDITATKGVVEFLSD